MTIARNVKNKIKTRTRRNKRRAARRAVRRAAKREHLKIKTGEYRVAIWLLEFEILISFDFHFHHSFISLAAKTNKNLLKRRKFAIHLFKRFAIVYRVHY